MVTILANRAWYDLRSTAHTHGLPFHTKQAKAQVYDRLYRSLIDEGVLRQRLKQLSDDERGALRALQAADGRHIILLFNLAASHWQPGGSTCPC